MKMLINHPIDYTFIILHKAKEITLWEGCVLCLLPLQNFQGLPFREIGEDIRGKELPSQCQSRRARQLQCGNLIPLKDLSELIDRSKL